jgi:hypothetical protein
MKQGNKKTPKTMDVLYASSMRDLIQKVNSLGIQKDDIVQVVQTDREFFLLYYK